MIRRIRCAGRLPAYLSAAFLGLWSLGLCVAPLKAFQESAAPSVFQDAQPPKEDPKPEEPKPAEVAPPKPEEPVDNEALKRVEELRRNREAARKQRGPAKPATDKPAGDKGRGGIVPQETKGIPQFEGGVPGTAGTQEINIPPADAGLNNVPPEERKYSFSIKEGTYEDLIESVARQTGLGVLGAAPEGKLTFVEPRLLSFTEMLSTVRLLLFNYKSHEPYWINYKKDHLEVKRVVDLYRELGVDRMFPSVEAFRESNLPDEELALLVFTPKSGSIADLREVRNFLPDYVRVSPVEGQNSLIIFALVRDLKKYNDLADFFGTRGTDPRTLKVFKIEHAVPSDVVVKLQALMGLDRPRGTGGGGAAPGRSGRPQEPNPLENIPEPEVELIPDDALHRIVALAMQDKIRDAERLLPILDVPPEVTDYPPVLIEVKHQDAAELCHTIQQILTATPDAGIAAAGVPKAGKKKKGQSAATPAPPVPMAPVKAEDITLIPQSERNLIIVLAPPEGVEKVRKLAATFDVKSEVGPLQIPMKHVAASEIVASIMAVLGGDPTQAPFHLVSDRSEEAVWFTGTEKDLTLVKELTTALDIPEPQAVMHIVELRYQKPTFVATMLRSLDSGEPVTQPPVAAPAAPPKKGGKKSKASVRVPDPSKFTADDETNRLYVLCTDDEWRHYSKIIEDLEAAAKPQGPIFEKLILRHLSAETAIERLNAMIPTSDEAARIRYAPAEGGILVKDATPALLDDMRAILVELDKPSTILERTFEIRHADPAEIESLIISLLGETGSAPRPKPRKGAKPEEGAAVVVPTTAEGLVPLTVARLGNRLVVRASPEIMQRVEDLIRQFDVAMDGTEMRIYADFAPGMDIEGIANTLYSVFSGSAPAAKSGKKQRPEAVEGPRFIAQSAQGKLIVLADPADFDRIEDLLDVLRSGGPESGPVVTKFVDLQYADPAELVEHLDPLLATKIHQWIVTGELVEPTADTPAPSTGRKRSQSVSRNDRYHLEPDARNRRIVIAAPQKIVDEAVALIREFDRPGIVEDDVILRTVNLTNSDAAEMVRAVRDLIGAGPPRTSSSKKAKGAPAPSADTPSAPLTITEAPGGKAVVLRGMPEDVEQAVKWVEEINNQSLPGRSIKVYHIQRADITKLADLIMNVADIPERPTGGRNTPAAPKGKGKEDELEEPLDEDFTLVNTRVGSEVYVQTDVLAKTMIVAASQAKIAQIDRIVAQFDAAPEENGEDILPPTKSVPKFIYELKHKDAFGASWDLETLLEAVWEPPNELPHVKEAGFGEALIIRYPYENRFDEIRELIEKYVDKPSKEDTAKKRKVFVPPAGVSPQEAAQWLKLHYPELDIEIVLPAEKPEDDFGVEQIKPPKQASAASPCVLPTAFARAAMLLAADAAIEADGSSDARQEQPEPEEEPPFDPSDILNHAALQAMQQMAQEAARQGKKEESGEKSGDKPEESKKRKPTASGPVKILVDQDRGALVVEGTSGTLEEITDGMDDLEEEIKDLPEKPDIRIYRVRYIDVYTAEEILNEMFNTPRAQQAQNAQQQALMQRMQQMQQMQAMRQQGGPPGQPGPPGRGQEGQQPGQQPGQQGARGMPQIPPQFNFPQLGAPSSVRVVPNPRDRTLILRAHTSQYPEILKLLATIDQPKPIDSELKVFPLEKLNAAEVENTLKEMLGLDQPAGGARRANVQGAPGGQTSSGSAGGTLPQRVEAQPITGLLPLTVDPKDIKIISNEDANSVLVMAPKEAVEYLGKLIEQLESQQIADRITKHYALKYADVLEVSEYLTNQFAEARSVVRGARRKGREPAAVPATPTPAMGSGSINAPTFVAYTRLNMLSVQATQEQMTEIDGLIATLDVRAPEEQWETIALAHADAKGVADTLTAMFGSGGGGGGGTNPAAAARARPATSGVGPKFIGEEGGRIVFFTAPLTLHEPIHAAVTKLEQQSEHSGSVRIIELTYAIPSEVADTIESAYSGRRGGAKAPRGPGGSSAAVGTGRFTITPNDATKRLFVVADDEMFEKIDSLAKNMDRPKQIGFDVKIYPLKFANARAVHGQMTKLVTDYLRMMGGKGTVEPFSADVDDRANALVILGGPVVFGFVEKTLSSVDVPGNANPQGFYMVVLKNADAQEVAGNIQRLWAQKVAGQGESPPQVEANRATNAVIVRGAQSQIEEIKKQVIEPLEQQALPALKSETITLHYAQAEIVAESVKRIFDEKKQAWQAMGSSVRNIPPAELTVAVTPDVNTNQVIVQASESNMAQIKSRIAELDKPEVAGQTATSTKTYYIRYADSNTVANMITQWARARTPATPTGRVAPRDQVTALAEPSTQSVVVTANEANHKLIEQMIKDVDTDKAVVDKSTVVYTPKHADPNALMTAITTAFRPESRGGRPRPEDQVTASVESATQSLIVTASTKNHEAIRTLIEKADAEPLEPLRQETHVIALKNADAEALSRTLNETFVRSAARPGGQQTITVSALPGSRAILVKSKADDFNRISAIVAELDRDDVAAGEEVRVVPILYGDATEMQTALQEYLKKPGTQGGRGTSLIGDVRVSVLSQGNAVVISGDKEEVHRLEETIHRLDTATEKGSVPQIIALKHASVAQILPSVQELFETPVGGARRNQPPPTVVADETLNALVVRAGPTDLAAIKGVVEQLDTPEMKARKSFRIIKVAAGVNLNKLAEDVEEAVNESAQAQTAAIGRGRQQPGVTITPNTQTRTLLVSGTPTLFDQVEDMIRAFESMGPPAGEVTTAIFRPTNITAEEVQALIDQLTEQGGQAGRSPGRRSGGGTSTPRPPSRIPPRRQNP